MRNVANGLAAGLGLVGVLTSPVIADAPKIIESHAIVASQNHQPLYRTEGVVTKLPLNSDSYMVWEHQGATDFYKLRAQSLPLRHGPFSLGGTAQHVQSTNGKKSGFHDEVGLVGRINGKIAGDFSGKADIRYFPEAGEIDTYAFTSGPKVFADVLGSYNTKTGSGFLRPGIEYAIIKRLTAGFEGKFAGPFGKMRADYFGLRTKVNF